MPALDPLLTPVEADALTIDLSLRVAPGGGGWGAAHHFFLAPLPGAVAGRRIEPGFALSAA